MDKQPVKKDIEETHELIKPFINRTPVLTSKYVNTLSGADVFFKCENFQKVGAFKMRGACNAVLRLTPEKRKKGVATHSSGNHAQALALSARLNSTKAFIVMPSNAPKVKKNAVLDYGGKIIECEPTLEARERTLKKVVEETGAAFIHPYDNYDIISGQATAAKELLEDTSGLDLILAPVGGGGLLSGTTLSAHYFSKATSVIGCEPEGADDAWGSFNSKKLIPVGETNTIADGLLTSLSDKTFEIIMKHVSDILTVSDVEIKQAMRIVWERMKIVIEPSAAVPLAVLLKNKDKFKEKKIGIILSGGNIDLDSFRF